MLIDPFTTIAQIVNFLILLWLLKKFLYRPILEAMQKREEEIANRLKTAKEKSLVAEKESEKYRRKQEEWEANKSELMAQLQEEVETQRQLWIQEAKAEISRMRSQWYQAFEREQETIVKDFQERINQQIEITINQALHSLANLSLEEQIINRFLDNFAMMKNQLKSGSTTSLDLQAQTHWQLVSSFPLNSATQRQLIQALETTLEHPVKVEFERETDLICGVELRCQGYKLAWNLADYLQGLQEQLQQAFKN